MGRRKIDRTTRAVKRRKRVVKFVTVTRKIVTVGDIYVSFGVAVKQLRLNRGMTQQDLAEKTNFSRASIVNIEQARQRVMLGDLWEFAKALKEPPQRLFGMLQP